jgi:DNA-directed RNA polymerase subunit RPC12/RpoP
MKKKVVTEKELKPKNWAAITKQVTDLTAKMADIKKRKLPKKWSRSKKPIWINRARCTICGDIIESKSVHDFVQCECGKIFVDGGHEYRRLGFEKITDIEVWDSKVGKFKPLKN